MNLNFMVRHARLLVVAGAVAIVIGMGVDHARFAAPTHSPIGGSMQLADGSESTGKPPKPKPVHLDTERMQFVDGSESTGKPPKPKPAHFTNVRLLLADGTEGTGKPPKPKSS